VKTDLRCYCCGEPVGETFALVTMQPRADRVFLMRLDHAERADGVAVTVRLTR
jgi:hypothetical protein